MSIRSAKVIIEVIGITILALVLSILFGIMFLVPIALLGYDLFSTSVLIVISIIGQVVFLLVAIIYIGKRDIDVPLDLPSRSDSLYILGGILATLITAISLTQALYLLDLMPDSPLDEMAASEPRLLLALALLSVVLVAPAEELLFRGAIQGRLRQNFGPVLSVGVASILFGALHLGNFTGEPLSIVLGAVLITVISLILGALYELTENLSVPIIVHAIYNVVLLISSYMILS